LKTKDFRGSLGKKEKDAKKEGDAALLATSPVVWRLLMKSRTTYW